MPQYRITLTQAVNLVEAYRDKILSDTESNGKLKNILGGTINASTLVEDNKGLRFKKYDGLVAWMCYKPTPDSDKDDVFLAFEIHEDFNQSTTRRDRHFPKKPILDRPFDIYRYNPSTDSDVKNLLSTHGMDRMNIKFPGEINGGQHDEDYGSVFHLKTNFREKGPEKGGKKLNEFALGFFDNETNDDVNIFLRNPKLKYIRYYFGYDESKKINNIRIILIGVDQQGNNMVPKNDRQAFEDGPLILQKAWPPPSPL